MDPRRGLVVLASVAFALGGACALVAGGYRWMALRKAHEAGLAPSAGPTPWMLWTYGGVGLALAILVPALLRRIPQERTTPRTRRSGR